MSELTTIAIAEKAEDTKPAPQKRHSKASVGAFWSFAGYGGSNVIRLGSNLILTRLLFEEAFGLMALVTVFMQGLQMFSDIGVGPNIVQNARGNETRFLNTAWTMQVMRGVVLWLVACFGAVPFAALYGQPLLVIIIPLSGFTAFLAGLNSTKLYSQLRHLDLKRFVSVDLYSQAAGMVAMVTWALVDRSVWALVAGGIFSCLVKVVLTHAILPGTPNHFAWDKTAAKAIYRFGGWIFISTSLTWADRHLATLVFASQITMAMMGIYSIGLMAATLMPLALGHISQNVLFPLYSQVLQRGEAVAPVLRRARTSVLIVAGWSLSGLMAGGQIGIDLLWDDRYADAGWVLRLLSVGAWFTIQEETNRAALLAQGKADKLALHTTGKLLAMVILIPLGFHVAGFHGAVAGYALTEVSKYAVSVFTIARAGLSNWRRDCGLSLVVAAAAVIGSFAGETVRSFTDNTLLSAITVFIVATAVWAPLAWTWKKRLGRAGKSFFGD